MTADQMLFTEKDLEKSMDKIETVHFHEVRLEKWKYAFPALWHAIFVCVICKVHSLNAGRL